MRVQLVSGRQPCIWQQRLHATLQRGSQVFGGASYNADKWQYVNSFPVTAIRYGIQNLSETYFGGAPDVAVAGPNVGANLGLTTQVSGTVGAATEAVKLGIPGIAFSGATGSETAWNAAPDLYEEVYADLSTTITQAVVKSGTPYLPAGIWLNVNYPAVNSTTCSSTSDFKFVLSRINDAVLFEADGKCCSLQLFLCLRYADAYALHYVRCNHLRQRRSFAD